MKNDFFRSYLQITVLLVLMLCTVSTLAQELQPITLPPPQKTGGMPLMEALNLRQTTRSISDQKLPIQVLSNLLWAAFGVNRENGPRGKVGRTAPSAMNMQEIDIYVAFAEGVYLYEAIPHRLVAVASRDVRSMANRRSEAANAPVILIFVADTDKKPAPRPGGSSSAPARPSSEKPPLLPEPPKEPQVPPAPTGTPQPPSGVSPSFGEVDSGFIGQNVYLFCASEGLAAWFHTADKEGLAKALHLREAQKVLYAQTVGYPAAKK